MDIQEYISSGILESYVLGFCTQAEAEEVERLMIEHVSIREEIRAIQETLELAALSSPIEPSAGTKSKIWNAINEHEEIAPVIPINRPESYVNDVEERTISGARNKNWLTYAASFALIFGTASVAIYFYSQSRNMENQLAAATQSNEKMKAEMLQSKDSLGKIGSTLNLIADAGTKKVTLAGVPTSKDSKAVVFWNESKKQVMLTGIELPQAPTDKQYQLWALVDGVPVDAGVFDYSAANSMIEMKSIDKSQAFAITLEPKGGSVSPHLEALYVIGNV